MNEPKSAVQLLEKIMFLIETWFEAEKQEHEKTLTVKEINDSKENNSNNDDVKKALLNKHEKDC